MSSDEIVDLLISELDRTRGSTLPRLVQVSGPAGTGKTFTFQRFYDRIARQSSSYWLPGLTPRWPPVDNDYVHRSRRIIAPAEDLRNPDENPEFLWLGINAPRGSQQNDAVGGLIRQLQLLIHSEVEKLKAARARTDWAVSAVSDLIVQFNPTISAIVAILNRFKDIQKLRASTQFMDDEKRDLHDLLRAYAKARTLLGRQPIPLIVLIDDASMASTQLLSLLNALILRPEADVHHEKRPEHTYGSQEDYLVSQINEMPPLPTMLIAATWPESSPATKSTPSAQWIRSFRKLGLQASLCTTRNFSSREAGQLLTSPHSNLLAEIGERILSNSTVSGQVNPLVLAGALGEVHAHRDPFTGAVDIQSADLRSLPSTAVQVMASRLSYARERTWGQAAVVLAKMIATAGGTVPWELIRLLTERHEEIDTAVFQIMNDERLAAFPAELSTEMYPLDLVRIDPELYNFFLDTGISEDERQRLAKAIENLLKVWPADLEQGEYSSTYEWEVRENTMRDLAAYVYGTLPRAACSPMVLALVDPNFTGPATGSSAGEKVGIYLFTRGRVHDSYDELINGALALLPSPMGWHAITFLLRDEEFHLADTLLTRVLELSERHLDFAEGRRLLVKVLLLAGDIDSAANVATSLARYDSAVVPPVVDELVRRDRHDQALQLLARFRDNPNACVAAAKILSGRGDDEAAMQHLQPLAYSDWIVASFYLDLLRQRRTPEARELMAFWAEHYPPAAIRFSRFLRKRGESDRAIEILRRYSEDPESQLEVARIQWSDGDYLAAIMSLASCPPRYVGTAAALAKFLNDIGDRGLRFRADGGDLRSAGKLDPRDEVDRGSRGEVTAKFGGRADIERLRKVSADVSSDELIERYGAASTSNPVLAEGLAEIFIRRSEYARARKLLQNHGDDVRAACTLAELEVQIGGLDGLEAARAVLEGVADESAPVQGRLAALDAVTGSAERSVARLDRLSRGEVGYGVIAIFTLFGVAPKLESQAWRELNRVATKPKLSQLLRMISAGRALAIARGSGKAETDLGQICDSWWESPDVRSAVVRVCEGVSYSYSRDRSSVSPPLRPYQILSMVECMRWLGRTNRGLEEALVDQIRQWYRLADPKLRQDLAEWLDYSTLVGQIVL